MNKGLKLGIGIAVVLFAVWFFGTRDSGNSTITGVTATPSPLAEVKEFAMTSYYDPVGKKPHFSLSEIVVRKGDRVRMKVTNTFGAHNFKIDELNVFAETSLNQEAVIEFTADQAGEFVYYCGMPGHRQAGQFGTLRVTE